MYICDSCGDLCEELHEYIDMVPYGSQSVPMVTYGDECSCCGSYEEAKPCTACGEWINSSDGEVCDRCADEYTDFEHCLKIAQADLNTVASPNATIEVNALLAIAFTEQQISQILFEALKDDVKTMPRIGMRVAENYRTHDDYDFRERISAYVLKCKEGKYNERVRKAI